MNIKERILNAKKPTIWDFGNMILYDLCKYHFGHKKDSEIIGKIWLIGRAYAVSIDRVKNKEQLLLENEKYEEKVVRIIKNGKFDEKFERLGNDIHSILELHYEMTCAFNDISDLDKRSLASKYLHFHFPEKYYIYDSRAQNGIGKLESDLGIS